MLLQAMLSDITIKIKAITFKKRLKVNWIKEYHLNIIVGALNQFCQPKLLFKVGKL